MSAAVRRKTARGWSRTRIGERSTCHPNDATAAMISSKSPHDLPHDDLYIGYARNQSGELVHISEVPRGKACKCMCVSCDAPLVARQGDIRAHHFAHVQQN